MEEKEKIELSKIGFVAILGLVAISLTLFWLKGHKVHNYANYTFHFRNVTGLEEGAPVKWNGLRVGVVESVQPVLEDKTLDLLPSNELIEIGKKHLAIANDALKSGKLENLNFAREMMHKGQLEIALGKARNEAIKVRRGEHVEVKAVLTVKDLPVAFLNQVTITPSGLIGEQYLDISTLYRHENEAKNQNPEFIVLEPVRIDDLIRANLESAEGVRDLTNRINALFSDEDVAKLQTTFENVYRSLREFKLVKHLF